jgi:hypothetical protein
MAAVIAWMLTIVARLGWAILTSHTERRLLAELDASCRAPPEASPDTSPE